MKFPGLFGDAHRNPVQVFILSAGNPPAQTLTLVAIGFWIHNITGVGRYSMICMVRTILVFPNLNQNIHLIQLIR